MNINKKTFLIILMLSLQLTLTYVQIQGVLAENDEDLGFTEGQTIKYIVEKVDAEDYEKATGQSLTYAFEGINAEFNIEHIEKYDDFWSVEVEILSYKDEKNKNPSETTYTIYEDGEDFNPGSYFIPKDAEDYLKDWEDEYNGTEYEVKDLKVIYEVNDTEIIYEYQENGILSSYVVKYKGDECYEMVLSTGISYGFYYIGFLICGIVGVLIITIRKWRRREQ